jgi:hypothetical protein
MRLEGLCKLKYSNDLIGNRNPDLPTCRVVPQPITHLYINLVVYPKIFESLVVGILIKFVLETKRKNLGIHRNSFFNRRSKLREVSKK